MYYVLHKCKKNIYLCTVKTFVKHKTERQHMKQLVMAILIIAGITVATAVNARNTAKMAVPVTGSVVDVNGRPVAYATVIALVENNQAAGTTTDENGAFALDLATGDYTLTFEFLGYKPVEKHLKVDGATTLDPIILEEESIKIDNVEVTAQIIRREADRFVVDVANMPAAIGKDGVELLQSSPGVFINDDKITINGQSGTKVYVNEREIRYTGDRLLSYLRGLKTEDIQKIEVVPISGADYDADSSGGIIKITLRHKRDDGFMGGVYFRTNINDMMQSYSPSLNLDYRTGKWTLSASGNFSHNSNNSSSIDNTVYAGNDNLLESESQSRESNNWYNAKAGAIYEINDNHSIGAELEFNGYKEDLPTVTRSVFRNVVPPIIDESTGNYHTLSSSQNVMARFNYIAKLDTLGSQFKLLADYTHQQSESNSNYSTLKITTMDNIAARRDSLYRDNSGTNYNIVSMSASWDKVISPKFTLKTGAKYTYNLMESFSNYDYLDNQSQTWLTRPTYNYDVDYTENIAALYAIAVAKLGRWGITAGLRGEYTNTSGRNNVARQNYFSLFPNANVSFGLTKDQSYLLIGQYSRTIRRPGFWALNPARMQVSEYLYQVGNPNLTPGFVNNLSLSVVMKYKYTISLVANLSKDEINQVVMSDPENPNINYITNENLDRTELYAVSANLPFQFAKWWSANVNVSGGYSGTRIRKDEPQEFHPLATWSASMTFTLPLQFYLTVDYYGMTKIYYSNVVLKGRNHLSASIKKRLFKDKLTLSTGVYNLVPINNDFEYSDATFVRSLSMDNGWTRPMFTFSASYNFNAGKKFYKKSIESDADASRLNK